MQVRKAVITAAGRGTRQFPATRIVQKELLPVVDVDGVTRPAIQIIVAEALAAGVEQVGIVVRPGSDQQFWAHFRPLDEDERRLFTNKDWALREGRVLANMSQRIEYIYQKSPEGYGHAVYCAREWVGDDPFLLMLGDHLYLSATQKPCAAQVIRAAIKHNCNLSAMAVTPASQLHLFGTARGKPLGPRLYQVELLVEKPSPEVTERELMTPGLPTGHYLCFFGMHVFTPEIFEALGYLLREDLRERGEIQLTSAQEILRQNSLYLAYVIEGTRHDIGTPEGYVETLRSFAFEYERQQRQQDIPH